MTKSSPPAGGNLKLGIGGECDTVGTGLRKAREVRHFRCAIIAHVERDSRCIRTCVDNAHARVTARGREVLDIRNDPELVGRITARQ
jgi:hypothetical protein